MATKRKTPYDHLNAAAATLAKQVYTMAKAGCAKGAAPDVKTVKELEGLVKEAVGICLSLEKSESAEAPEIRVVFEDGIAEMAE